MQENPVTLTSFVTAGNLDFSKLRQQFSQASGSGLISISTWSVQYGAPDHPKWLEGSCLAIPMKPDDAILSLYLAVLSSDGSLVYTQGGTVVSPSTGNLVPGLELRVDVLTELYDPKKQGTSVLSAVFGAVNNGGGQFYLEQDFTIST